jgi:type II secretory pathway component GspD/PulD (secretin)
VLSLGPKFDSLATVLTALETQGLVNTLAEPNLTAISGETAGFLAGGEFPIPASRDNQGNIVLDYKQFGVSLNFTPTVMSKDRIALHLSTEVSDRDNADGVQLQGLVVPALTVRRAETTVELGSGNTIMIAGLLKSGTLNSLQGLPGAKDLPIIGQLFKSKSFQRNESELLIIVTPYLVNSYAEPDAVAEKTLPPALPGPGASPPLEKLPAVPVKTGEMNAIPAEKTASVPVKASEADITPAEKSILVPVKAANVAPVVPQQPAVEVSVDDTITPPAQKFMNNLKKVYGDKAVEKVGTRTDFGYIVE